METHEEAHVAISPKLEKRPMRQSHGNYPSASSRLTLQVSNGGETSTSTKVH